LGVNHLGEPLGDAAMINWIKGQDLIESHHKYTKQELFKFVQEGALVPYCSPDAEWIKKYKFTGPGVERIWRVFPTPELQKHWVMEVFLKKGKLEEAQDWLAKSDEDHIEAHKHDLGLDWDGNPPKYLSDIETFVDRDLPLIRQKYLQITKDFPSQIKNLEVELAPDRVWVDLDLGPAQQEALMGKLLDAFYSIEQVEYLSATIVSQPTTGPHSPKLPVAPDTHWEDIKITLLSDETVRIKISDHEEIYHYSEIGLSDKRKGDKPTQLWILLKLFAQNHGFISGDNIDSNYDSKLPDTAKRLNKHFKKLFGINDSIYQGSYKTLKGYKTKIFFSDTTVLVTDMRKLAKDKTTRAPTNTDTVIEDSSEIAEIFAEAQKWGVE
jgi:hypothetical protein